jgi:hypothetical protein
MSGDEIIATGFFAREIDSYPHEIDDHQIRPPEEMLIIIRAGRAQMSCGTSNSVQTDCAEIN